MDGATAGANEYETTRLRGQGVTLEIWVGPSIAWAHDHPEVPDTVLADLPETIRSGLGRGAASLAGDSRPPPGALDRAGAALSPLHARALRLHGVALSRRPLD